MPTYHTYNVIPTLPEALEPLREMVFNLWWTWEPSARRLFRHLDPELWNRTNHNPVRMLQLSLGWRGSGSLGPARGAGREALNAGAPQQPKHPHRVGRSALLASGSGPPAAPQSVRVLSPSASPAPR